MLKQNTDNQNDDLQVLQQENESLKQQVEQYRQNERIDRILWRAGARNPIAARAILAEKDIEKMKDEELESAVGALQEQEPYLFYPKMDTQKKLRGFTPAEGSDFQMDAFMNGFLNQ